MAAAAPLADDAVEDVALLPVWVMDPTESHATMRDGKTAAMKLEFGRWKSDRPAGNGKYNAYFVCTFHVGCGRKLKIHKRGGEVFCISLKGTHSSEVNQYKRKNSIMTVEEEAAAKMSLDQGGRPGAMLVSMTKKEVKRIQEAGEDLDAAQHDQGGLDSKHEAPPSPPQT